MFLNQTRTLTMVATKLTIVTALVFGSGLVGQVHAQTDAIAEPEREILNIRGDLYRFRQVRHAGVFLVTDDGIILVDPTFPEVSTWLKQQLDERFGLPVKYVIYSHTHNDHAGGGQVEFAGGRISGEHR